MKWLVRDLFIQLILRKTKTKMENRDVKILFSDMDDTLLNSDKQVSSVDRSSINKIIERGHKFVIATGRPLLSAIKLSEDLGFNKPGFYIIASNGGVVYDCTTKEVIVRRTVPFDLVKLVFDEAEKAGLHVQTYSDDFVISKKENHEIIAYTNAIRMPYKIVERIPEDLSYEPPKIIVISHEGRHVLEAFRDHMVPLLDNRLVPVFSSQILLEFLPPLSTKGNALSDVCRLCNIPIQNSIACGDQENDIPMIDAAGIGVAVSNATEHTKAHANYVTCASHNDNAITEVIEKFIL